MSAPQFYGMLYVASEQGIHVNLRSRGAEALRIYVRNAVTAARSAAAVGLRYALITNDVFALEAVLASEGLTGTLHLREHCFTLQVPGGIRFYAAHFKLDVLKAFGTGKFGEMVALLDIDVIFRGPVMLPTDRLTAYDISDAVFEAYGYDVVASDLARLAMTEITPRWFGGELLAGPAVGFAALGREIDDVWERYCSELEALHHVGDEAVLSSALCRLIATGSSIHEAGAAGIITRYWSTRTLRPMHSLAQVGNSAILHLPADKHWLSSLAEETPIPANFVSLLERRIRRRRPLEIFKQVVDLLRGRPLQYLPRLHR